MSATPSSQSALQRVNKAYVLVPPSPLSLSAYRPLRTPVHVALSSKLKENTPLRSSRLAMSQQSASSPSLKRKLSDRDSGSLVFDGVHPGPKRSKLSTGTPLKEMQIQPLKPASNACPEFPNGYTYCHQCNKKRDLMEITQCTMMIKKELKKKIKERQCSNKYCKSCLKNRYGEDFGIPMTGAHGLNGVTSTFKCPQCKGTCNCSRCRKARGLGPVGVMKSKAKEPHSISTPNKSLKVEVVIETKRPIPKAKMPKPLPSPKWTPVPTSMTQTEADDRIFIREFVLRFSDLLDPAIAKTYLEELEFVSGRTLKQDDELDTWVSEACIRAIFLGLLGLLSKNLEDNTSRMLKASLKEFRSAGNNLNKMWAVLASLRDDATNSQADGAVSPLAFPDPSPPPISNAPSAPQRRSTRQTGKPVNVIHSFQMIPVLVFMINSVLETVVIREDLDQCVKDSKDFARDAREATRLENDRWEKEKRGMDIGTKDKVHKDGNRTKRLVHREQIANIDNCLKLISRSFVSRFTTLGMDDEGRTYYALSPSVSEREAAFEYLELASSKNPTKPKKKGRFLSFEERRELRDWSWFIAVWGKRPPMSSGEKMNIDSGEEPQADPEAEKWWAFWEPEEIVKVADWISIKSGLDEKLQVPEQEMTSSSSKPSYSSKEKNTVPLPPRLEHIRRLVTELRDYATLLEWRVREDKCVLASRIVASSNGTSTSQTDAGSIAKGKDKVSEQTPIPAD